MKKKIGFVGLGNMGGRITRRLIAAGHSVLGFDPAPGRAEACGAKAAGSVAEVAKGTDTILLSLPDSTVVEPVAEEILQNTKTGQVVVDLSTAAPGSTMRLAARFAERGAIFIDAGISGGAAAAEKGTLTLMVGGDKAAADKLKDVFAPFATKVVYMGASGAGHTTKLLNNFLNAVSLAATAEVMVAGKKAGLDLHLLLEVLNASSGVNFATLNRFPKIVDGDYLEGGLTGKLMTKDVVLYVDRLHELGVASLNAAGPMASFGLGHRARLRRPDQQPRGGRHRRRLRRHPIERSQREGKEMKVFHARTEDKPSELRSETFSGTVWADPIMPATDGVMINNVFFAPGGRTHWHSHERGQMLNVIAGSGWVCLAGEKPRRIRAGDVVWISPGERHWHGADAGSYMMHMATSLGKTAWAEAVSQQDYVS